MLHIGAMELACPHCDARYRVADGSVPPAGRVVHCAKCGGSWHEAGGAATAMPFDPEPLGAGIPDVGGLDMGTIAYGPAAGRADDPAPEPLDQGRGGIGTIGWLLLIIFVGVAAAIGYALYTGQLSLP